MINEKYVDELDMYIHDVIGTGTIQSPNVERTNDLLEIICFELHRIANSLEKKKVK